MNRYKSVLGIIMLFSLAGIGALYADERPAYDILLVVDKSLSMEEEIGTVKVFLRNSIIDNNVQIGDFLVILDFYGQAEVVSAFPINSQSDIERAKSVLAGIDLNARHTHTDIGNALDLAQKELAPLLTNERPKVILLVTDGIQEALPNSKYFSADGKFTHELLEKATTIAKEGWKIQVIDIGGTQATKDFTEKIGGQYTKVSEKPTVKELEKTVEEFAGTIMVAERPDNLAVPENRQNMLKLKLKSQNYKKDQVVAVKEIRLTAADIMEKNVLEQPFEFTMPKEGEFDLSSKLFFPVDMEPGDHAADIQFIFSGETVFSPGVMSLNLHVNSFFENYPLLLVAIIAGGLAILALFVFLIVRLISSRGVKFRLKVEERPLKKGKDVFKVGYGKWLYLNESYSRLSLVPKRNLRSIGRIFGSKSGLEFEPLREEQFVGVQKTKHNVLGKKITVKTQDSELLHAEFVKL